MTLQNWPVWFYTGMRKACGADRVSRPAGLTSVPEWDLLEQSDGAQSLDRVFKLHHQYSDAASTRGEDHRASFGRATQIAMGMVQIIWRSLSSIWKPLRSSHAPTSIWAAVDDMGKVSMHPDVGVLENARVFSP